MLDTSLEAHWERLAASAEVYLENSFGLHLRLRPITPGNLPHFLLDSFMLWEGTVLDKRVILMAARHSTTKAFSQIAKHRELVRHSLGAPLVLLLLDRVNAAVRRRLIEQKIGFLHPGAQLYIPEALLDWRERTSSATVEIGEQLSPTTQLVVLAILLGEGLDDWNLTQLADRFETAIMSMSRTLDELEALQVAKARIVGRQRRLHMLMGGSKLWNVIKDRLQSPVRKVRTVKGTFATGLAPLSGESALAHYTMLADPRTPSRAIPASQWKQLERSGQLQPTDPYEDDRVQLETWAYAPQILAKNGVVDPLSLYLSVRTNPDERVEQAAQQLLEPFGW
jgi:hypothetical protein